MRMRMAALGAVTTLILAACGNAGEEGPGGPEAEVDM